MSFENVFQNTDSRTDPQKRETYFEGQSPADIERAERRGVIDDAARYIADNASGLMTGLKSSHRIKAEDEALIIEAAIERMREMISPGDNIRPKTDQEFLRPEDRPSHPMAT